eukprot:UN14921
MLNMPSPLGNFWNCDWSLLCVLIEEENVFKLGLCTDTQNT